ncbi:MAG: ATP-binding protein [Fibromonadaceae bacterium]|jgi:predicted AAA+ superfamily ATPase|nr:ATP-binding protein [Fibromonadaceae bacterium]
MLKRENYLKIIRSYREKPLIKVLSGVRRCGKSTLLAMFIKELKKEGIKSDQIISMNFEDLAYRDLLSANALYDYLKQKINKKKMNYIFLDEIQNVADFERVVDSLFVQKNVDLYITGSNAYFLSSDLATILTGRYIEIKVYPYSFAEFVSATKMRANLTLAYENYIECGSFPEAVNLFIEDKSIVDRYLQNLYDTVIFKDIVARKEIKNSLYLQDISKFIFDNIGNFTSPKRISDILTANNRAISNHTVENYLQALTDSFLVYPASRYDIKGRQILQTNQKYYAVDIGLRSMISDTKPSDYGHILENIVYLELLRRYGKVWVGKNREKEIDFVVKTKNGLKYFQVALSVRGSDTLKRELSAFETKDNYPKTLITMDPEEGSHNGVIQKNALKFLLG